MVVCDSNSKFSYGNDRNCFWCMYNVTPSYYVRNRYTANQTTVQGACTLELKRATAMQLFTFFRFFPDLKKMVSWWGLSIVSTSNFVVILLEVLFWEHKPEGKKIWTITIPAWPFRVPPLLKNKVTIFIIFQRHITIKNPKFICCF